MTATTITTPKPSVADAWRILGKLLDSRAGLPQKADQICREKFEQSLADYHASTIYPDEDKIAWYRELITTLIGYTKSSAKQPTTTAATAQEMFEELCKLTREAAGDSHKKVAAALRKSTGRSVALAVYHNDKSVPDDQKRALYAGFIQAVKSKDYSKILGEPEKEKAAPIITPEPPKESTSAATLPDPAPPVKPAVQSTPTAADPLRALIIQLVDERIAAALAGVSGPSEDQIKGVVKEALNNGSFPEQRVQSMVDTALGTHVRSIVRSEIRAILLQYAEQTK